jgi:hypothetical protein
MPDEGKNKDREDIEEEDGRNRNDHIAILCPDDGRDCRDCRTPADRRARADERGHIAIQPEHLPHQERRTERSEQCKDHDVERLLPDLDDMKEIHLEAEQDDRVLENFLARELNPLLHRMRPPLLRKQHAEQNTEHGTAHDWEVQPQDIRRYRKQQGIEDAVHVFTFHTYTSLT